MVGSLGRPDVSVARRFGDSFLAVFRRDYLDVLVVCRVV